MSGPVLLPHSVAHLDLFSHGPDRMCAFQDKSQSHPRADVTGLGPSWELPLSLLLSQTQITMAVGSLGCQMRHEDGGTSGLAAAWPSHLGWHCQTLQLPLAGFRPRSSFHVAVVWWSLGAQGL